MSNSTPELKPGAIDFFFRRKNGFFVSLLKKGLPAMRSPLTGKLHMKQIFSRHEKPLGSSQSGS
jgi:hypothetical protein